MVLSLTRLRETQLNSAEISKSGVSRFTFHRSDEPVYVRRMAGEKFNDHCVMKSVRIMVWGVYTLY